ncbi:GntR family transcriptional regulator [Tranquillimonas alkanivorans]|uniref:Transcriptional regulator, GntR family n=1 Tax=Tranquillimonas alkanivorans TaxID=441119 RepID=A0A1I5U7A1_9RHOB|nr:GntR family transcriptional regulator [Tranquillimonas alkanivorans]SFP91169.1 transcriptional regulator, GntR family [Tranquillimonas alkanivorans]
MLVRTDRETLRDKATHVIREAIMSLHYRPGEPLIERRICEDTGVSRTSVREALRLLEAEGLVRRESSRGLVVAELTAHEIRDIFDLRLILESELLRRYIEKGAASDLEAMAELLEQAQREAIRDGEDYTRVLSRFVQRIWEGGGNHVAARMLEALLSRINYIRVILYRTTSREEHFHTIGLLRSVLEEIEAGDAERAVEVYRSYLTRALNRMVEIIEAQKPR